MKIGNRTLVSRLEKTRVSSAEIGTHFYKVGKFRNCFSDLWYAFRDNNYSTFNFPCENEKQNTMFAKVDLDVESSCVKRV